MLGLGKPIEGLVDKGGGGLGLVFVVVLDLVDGVGASLLFRTDRTDTVPESRFFLEQVNTDGLFLAFRGDWGSA